MIQISDVALDYHRYQIHNCKFSYPLPLQLIGYHLWEFCNVNVYLLEWDWDLGHACLPFYSGYRVDGASIPVRAGSFVDPIAALLGSLPHDLLYETCGGSRNYRLWTSETTFTEHPLLDGLTGEPFVIDGQSLPSDERRRARADAVLRAFWIASGMSIEMAEIGYGAVRVFGRKSWISLEPGDKCDAHS